MRKSNGLLAVTITLTLLMSITAPIAANATATTVTVTKTAAGFHEQITLFDWTITAFTTTTPTITIEPGHTHMLGMTTTTTREALAPFTVQGVRGVITVINQGEPDPVPTINLRLEDQIIARPAGGGAMRTIHTVTWIPGMEIPALPADNTRHFNYEIQFDPSSWTNLHNRAYAHIDNQPGASPPARSSAETFSIPPLPTAVALDSFSILTIGRQWVNANGDPINAPPGVTLGEFTIPLFDSVTCISNLSISLDNTVPRNTHLHLKLAPLLTTDDTKTEVTDDDLSIVVTIYTGNPLTTTDARGQGYWRNHTTAWQGISPSDQFHRSGLTWLQALCMPPRFGDAYFILAKQYIAAYLNHQAGVPMPTGVQTAFTAATSYFTTSDPGRLTGGRLSTAERTLRNNVLHWAQTLEHYNQR